jgi:hypothetical protein
MDEGNQRLLFITVLLEEEKQLDHEKMENKRNSSKGLSADWKKKKKKEEEEEEKEEEEEEEEKKKKKEEEEEEKKKKKRRRRTKTKRKFDFPVFVREQKWILYVHFGACCNLVRYSSGE